MYNHSNSSINRIIQKANITTYSQNVYQSDNSTRAVALKFRPRQHAAAMTVAPRATTCTPVDSTMCVKSDTPNALRLNIASSVFDTEFETRPILFVNLIRNLDGTVDLSIVYESDDRYPQYPSNPTSGNFIKPFDINSPFYGELRYEQF